MILFTEPLGFTKALGALSRNNIENTERALKGSEGRGRSIDDAFARSANMSLLG